MKAGSLPLAEAMRDAEFVQINGIVFETEYLRVPDEATMAEDVVMELKLGDAELEFTRDELDDAEYVGDGHFLLKSGAILRFLSSPTIH
jgi:hypothetical protein